MLAVDFINARFRLLRFLPDAEDTQIALKAFAGQLASKSWLANSFRSSGVSISNSAFGMAIALIL